MSENVQIQTTDQTTEMGNRNRTITIKNFSTSVCKADNQMVSNYQKVQNALISNWNSLLVCFIGIFSVIFTDILIGYSLKELLIYFSVAFMLAMLILAEDSIDQNQRDKNNKTSKFMGFDFSINWSIFNLSAIWIGALFSVALIISGNTTGSLQNGSIVANENAGTSFDLVGILIYMFACTFTFFTAFMIGWCFKARNFACFILAACLSVAAFNVTSSYRHPEINSDGTYRHTIQVSKEVSYLK